MINTGHTNPPHPPFSKCAIHNRKIAVSTCKNLAFHILKENTIDMKDVKVKSFSNPGVAICNISNWNSLSVTRRWENKDKVRFFSNPRVAVRKVSNWNCMNVRRNWEKKEKKMTERCHAQVL